MLGLSKPSHVLVASVMRGQGCPSIHKLPQSSARTVSLDETVGHPAPSLRCQPSWPSDLEVTENRSKIVEIEAIPCIVCKLKKHDKNVLICRCFK